MGKWPEAAGYHIEAPVVAYGVCLFGVLCSALITNYGFMSSDLSATAGVYVLSSIGRDYG